MSEVNREEQAMIPYYAHEGEMSRMERANKRLWIIIIILIVALLGTNAGWIIYESQFQDIVTTVEQEVDTGRYGDRERNGGCDLWRESGRP